MLDKNYVIEHLDEVIERLNTRNGDYSYLRQLPELVNKRNAAIKERDDLKAMRNSASKQIGALMAQKKIEEANELKKKVSESKDKIAADDKLALELDEEIRQMLLKTPNLPDPSLPIGTDDSFNKAVKYWGTPRDFKAEGFEPKSHWVMVISTLKEESRSLDLVSLSIKDCLLDLRDLVLLSCSTITHLMDTLKFFLLIWSILRL